MWQMVPYMLATTFYFELLFVKELTSGASIHRVSTLGYRDVSASLTLDYELYLLSHVYRSSTAVGVLLS